MTVPLTLNLVTPDGTAFTQTVQVPAKQQTTFSRFGAWCGFGHTPHNETLAQCQTRVRAAFGGKLGGQRFYPGTNPNGTPGLVGAEIPVVTFDWDIPSMPSGSSDSAILQAMANLPRDRTVYFGIQHEPQIKISHGSYTAAQYKAAWLHFANLVRPTQPANVKLALIMDQYSNRIDPTAWRAHYAGPQYVDALGWDCYWISTDSHRNTATNLFSGSWAETQKEGKDYLICELSFGDGSGAGNPGGGGLGWTDAQVTQLTKDTIAFLDGKTQLALWFESDKTGIDGNWLIEGIHPGAQAAWSAVCAR